MTHLRALAWPTYLLAALLLLFPLVDTLVTVVPLRPEAVTWRFGAAGLFSRVLVTPLLGLLLITCMAMLLEQRKVLQSVSALGLVAAILLAAVIGLFALDALQMRAQVDAQVRRSFDVATLTALAKYGGGLVTALAIMAAAWRGARVQKHHTRAAGAGGADLVIAGRTPSARATHAPRERTVE